MLASIQEFHQILTGHFGTVDGGSESLDKIPALDYKVKVTQTGYTVGMTVFQGAKYFRGQG